MGLTGHNKRRREMAEAGSPGYLQAAKVHHQNAANRVAELEAALKVAKEHEGRCAFNLKQAQMQAFEEMPEEVKKELRKQASKGEEKPKEEKAEKPKVAKKKASKKKASKKAEGEG